MDEILYIVVTRDVGGPWKEKVNGVFTERRLAENYIECCKASGYSSQFGIVEGPIVSPETMAEAEQRLGAF